MSSYYPYFLDGTFARTRVVDLSEFPKRYNGDPQALVLKASPTLVGNRPRKQITNVLGETINIGIPEDVLKDAAHLVSLWNRAAPEVDKQISKRHQDPGTDSSSGGVKKKKKSPRSNKGIAKSSKSRGRSGRSRGIAKGTSKNRSHPRDNHGAIAYLVTENEGYAWGPDMTAADIMSVFASWQRSHELDRADQAKRLLEQSRQQNQVAI